MARLIFILRTKCSPSDSWRCWVTGSGRSSGRCWDCKALHFRQRCCESQRPRRHSRCRCHYCRGPDCLRFGCRSRCFGSCHLMPSPNRRSDNRRSSLRFHKPRSSPSRESSRKPSVLSRYPSWQRPDPSRFRKTDLNPGSSLVRSHLRSRASNRKPNPLRGKLHRRSSNLALNRPLRQRCCLR